MSTYTDEDVIAGTQAYIAHYKAERGITGTTYLWEGVELEVRAILDAVAPAIAARTLRETARTISDDPDLRTCSHDVAHGMDDWLEDRADRIEGLS